MLQLNTINPTHEICNIKFGTFSALNDYWTRDCTKEHASDS